MRRLTCICAIALLLPTRYALPDDDLAARLGSPDPHVARQAIEDAASRGPDAIPELRAVLLSDDDLAAEYAAVALGRINSPGAEYALLESLRREALAWDPYLTQFAGEALAARGADAVPLLRRALWLDRPVADVDDEEMWRYNVGACIGALPTDLMNTLLADIVARSVASAAGNPAILFLEQGEAGMRLWAESFLRDDPLPTVEEANAAWRLPPDKWGHLTQEAESTLRFGSIDSGWQPNPYRTAISQYRPDYLWDLGWEYARSDRPEQCLWGFAQLLMQIPHFSASTPRNDEVIRAILTDPHWRIPLLLERDGLLDLHEKRPAALRDALRTCMKNEGEAGAALAAVTLLEIADRQAIEFAAERLPDACPQTAQILARAIANSDYLSDEQRMSLLDPLIECAEAGRLDYVMIALSRMPAAAAPQVAELLGSSDEGTRAEAAWAPGEIGSAEAGGPRNPSPPVLQQAAWEVLRDEGRSDRARWNAAALIIWDAFERQGGLRDEDPNRMAGDIALVNGDLWPAVEMALRHPEFYDHNDVPHVGWAVEHARRDEAVPLLQAWATRAVEIYPRPDNILALETLARIEPRGVQWLIEQVREDHRSRIGFAAARALMAAGVVEGITPITERARRRDRRAWLDILSQFEGEAGDAAIRETVVSLPPDELTSDDLLALMHADIGAAQEIARGVLTSSRDWRLRSTAVETFVWQAAPEARKLLLRVARDDLELCVTRYRALRAVEKFDLELARRVAEQWTHDRRFVMRDFGRQVLRGPAVAYY